MRRYGLYSSRGRGTWNRHPALRMRAPTGWYGRRAAADPSPSDTLKDHEVDALCRRKAWARLLAKVHELDVMACPRCGSRMSVIAVIVDPAQIRKIIDYLNRHGRGPPPLGRALQRSLGSLPLGRGSTPPPQRSLHRHGNEPADRYTSHLAGRDSRGSSVSSPTPRASRGSRMGPGEWWSRRRV